MPISVRFPPVLVSAVVGGSLLLGAGCGTAPGSSTVAPSESSAAASSPAPISPASTSSAPAATPLAASPSPSSPTSSTPPTTAAPATRAELPGGGRTLFPRYRLVGYAGRTGATTLGRLGTGALDQRVRELKQRAKPYEADGRTVMPVLEVIATTVQAKPGGDGKFRTRMPDSEIKRYLAVARKHDALLLLAIQPGRADFLAEVKAYDRWLAQPDVGVALDPEWAMGPGQVPGRVFGHTTGSELDSIAKHLSSLARERDLPQKVMVFHELAAGIVTKESQLRAHPGVVQIKSIDGIGSRAAKESTYRVVNKETPKGVQPGFKLFYDEDRHTGGKVMTPAQVLALKPRPVYVMYE